MSSPFFIGDAPFGAGEGNRTLVCSLGSCRSTIELRPQNQCFSGTIRPSTAAACLRCTA